MLLFFKALHFIGFVAWFAGLFYLVRMFVYHVESSERPPEEAQVLVPQYNLMQWRVYRIICNPAMMITWAAGLSMILLYGWDWFRVSYWLHIKLVLLIGLTVYHVWCKQIILQLEAGKMVFSSYQFRLWNEVPTLFLVVIVLLAVYKNTLNGLWAILGMLGFGVALFVGTKWYKKAREKNPKI